MSGPRCVVCGDGFTAGEEAFASDWTVIEPDGPRMETRYTHIVCGDEATSPP